MPSRSDKLFQKRHSSRRYPRSRQAPFRRPRDRVLIACEGSKTEPQYFDCLVSKNPSVRVAIQVHGEECGSDPVSVVEHGYSIAKQEGHHTKGGYRHVYCVVDGDNVQRVRSADEKARGYANRRQKPFETFQLVRSVPCFELWYILHFGYHSAPILGTQGRSAGAEACRILRGIPDMCSYKKLLSEEQLAAVLARTEAAIGYSKRLIGEVKSSRMENPFTEVHHLVGRVVSDDWQRD